MAIIKCPNCDNTVSDKAVKCINCGYVLSKNMINFCSECGNELNINDIVCSKCGCPIERNLEPQQVEIVITKKNKLKIILILIILALIASLTIFFIVSLKELRDINEEVIKGNKILQETYDSKAVNGYNKMKIYFDY